MKKITFALAVMAIALTACGQNKKEMKTLVAYFSATGTTEAVAKDLAAVAGADLYEIKPEVKYTAADLDWCDKQSRSFIEAYGFKGKTVMLFATSGGSDIDGADKQFHEQYKDINWKAGKLLNGASQADMKAWVASNK